MENPPADNEVVHERLSKFTTIWSMLASANDGDGSDEASQRLQFMQRYQRAAYRFLLGESADMHTADELFQEGVLRFVRGDSRDVDPQEVTSREFLRVTLTALINGHKQVSLAPQLPATLSSTSQSGEAMDQQHQFLTCSREEMLDRAWICLQQAEQQGGPPHFSVLRFRAEHPDQSSAEVALEITLAKHIQPALSAHDLRDMLQRARQQYAEHLLDEVIKSLTRSDSHAPVVDVELELRELDLLRFCRGALQRRGMIG